MISSNTSKRSLKTTKSWSTIDSSKLDTECGAVDCWLLVGSSHWVTYVTPRVVGSSHWVPKMTLRKVDVEYGAVDCWLAFRRPKSLGHEYDFSEVTNRPAAYQRKSTNIQQHPEVLYPSDVYETFHRRESQLKSIIWLPKNWYCLPCCVMYFSRKFFTMCPLNQRRRL